MTIVAAASRTQLTGRANLEAILRAVRTARATSIGPAILVGASTMLGLAAALVGGPLIFLGRGPGGLDGLPAILLFGFAAAAVAAAAWILVARRRPRDAALLFFEPIVVLTAFMPVAHALDPCDGGAWSLTSHVEGIPLCECVLGVGTFARDADEVVPGAAQLDRDVGGAEPLQSGED